MNLRSVRYPDEPYIKVDGESGLYNYGGDESYSSSYSTYTYTVTEEHDDHGDEFVTGGYYAPPEPVTGGYYPTPH